MTNAYTDGTCQQTLREGFTTGSAVSAAASAALTALLAGENPQSVIVTPPPDEKGGRVGPNVTIPVDFCERIAGNDAPVGHAGVTKDAGDDPDVTDGMLFTVHAAKNAAHFPFTLPDGICPPLPLGNTITLHAGPGIGLVTLPGLPIEPGEMAINPAPRRQIAAMLCDTASRWGYKGPIHCRITAHNGEKIAARTLNPRLGITGGISILGTRGTVKPFSAEAWKTTIIRSLDVATSLHCPSICLTTGRRSENAMQTLFPKMHSQAFIQVADHAGFALGEAASRGFARILWACFPGKLLKLAQGLAWTHAHDAAPDFALFAQLAAKAGASEEIIATATRMPTVTGALEHIQKMAPGTYPAIIHCMGKKAHNAIRKMASPKGRPPSIHLYIFDIQGHLLTTVRE